MIKIEEFASIELSNQSPEAPKQSEYRVPSVMSLGKTKNMLNGSHGVGQESQGYAPKQN